MALLIFLGHLWSRVPNFNFLISGKILSNSLYMIVGVFFFFTGYGLSESFKSKPNYEKKFLKHRILPFYLDCVIFSVIYILVKTVIGSDTLGGGYLSALLNCGKYITNGWYLQAALLVYIGFYIAYRFSNGNQLKLHIFLLGMLLGYILYYCILDFKSLMFYLQSISGVVLGYIWSYRKEKINGFLNRKYHFICVFSLMILCITFFIGFRGQNILLCTIMRMIATIFFIVCLICFCMIVPLKNKFTLFFGKISFEFYAIHGLFLDLFQKENFTEIQALYYCLVTIISGFCAAWILNILISKFNSFIKAKFQ